MREFSGCHITTSKAYHVFNKVSREVEESINVKFADNVMGARGNDEDDEPSLMQNLDITQH